MAKPMFQHRHYVALAAIVARLQAHTDESRKIDLHAFVRETADLFQRDNDGFDRGRYEAACAGSPQTRRDAA